MFSNEAVAFLLLLFCSIDGNVGVFEDIMHLLFQFSIEFVVFLCFKSPLDVFLGYEYLLLPVLDQVQLIVVF